MLRRILRAICGRVGHLPAQAVEGTYEGWFIKASICPRCHFVFAQEVGPRRVRRREWRDRLITR
jgi:hypothetical protein